MRTSIIVAFIGSVVLLDAVVMATASSRPSSSLLQTPISRKHSKKQRLVVPAFTGASTTEGNDVLELELQGERAAAATSNVVAGAIGHFEGKLSPSAMGWSCIIGGLLAHLACGSIYCWGNFLSYCPPHLRFFDGVDRPGQPDALLVLPVTLVSQCIMLPIGPLLVKRFGASNTLLGGALVFALGVYLSSYARNLFQFLLSYAFIVGAGIGAAYTAPMIAGWSWLPLAKGLVSGTVLLGFGAGGFFFNIIGTKLANPSGLNPTGGKFPSSVYENFPKMLRTLAMVYASLAALGSLLVHERTSQAAIATSPAIAADVKVSKPITQAIQTQAPHQGLDIVAALKTPQFWLMWFMVISSASAGLNVASIYKQFAVGAGPALAGDGFQSLVGGMGALFNGGGRLFWGIISDKIGFKTSFAALTVLQAAVHALYPLTATSKPWFLAMTCLCFFCLAGNFALMPPAVQRVFGPKNGAVIYGILYSAFGVASIGGLVLSKVLTAKLGVDNVFRTLAGVSLIASILTMFLKPVRSLPSSAV